MSFVLISYFIIQLKKKKKYFLISLITHCFSDEWKTSFELSKTADTDKEDNFSTAFQILLSSNDFITLLNMMADELVGSYTKYQFHNFTL